MNNSKFHLLLLSGSCLFFFFFNIWKGSLAPWDESCYAEVAREIVQEHTGWLTLHFNYQPWFDKPPLLIWMIALMFKIFGINEFSVRFWSALSGWGCCLLTYYFSRDMVKSNLIALFSALSLPAYTHFLMQSRVGMLDAPLTFLILLGVYVYWKGLTNKTLLFLIGPIFALAFMTKGFAAIPLLFIIFLHAILTRNIKVLLNRYCVIGLVVGAVIFIPWYFIQFQQHGTKFIDEFFVQKVFKRATTVLPGRTPRSIFFYFEMLFRYNFPLGIVSFFTLPLFIRLIVKEKSLELRTGYLLILCSIFTVFLLYTAVKSKIHWYILPAYPFLSLTTWIVINKMWIRRMNISEKPLHLFVIIAILLFIPGSWLATNPMYNQMDFSADLKMICSDISRSTLNGIYTDIKERPPILFYCRKPVEQDLRNTSLKDILSDDSHKPFILLSHRDGFSLTEDPIYMHSLISSNNKYIAYEFRYPRASP